MPNREQLLEQIRNAAKPKLVPFKFAGVECFVRKWGEKDAVAYTIYNEKAQKEGRLLDYRCNALARSLCDSDGNLLYDPDKLDDLASLDFEVITEAYNAVAKVQKLVGSESDDEAKN